VDNAEIGILSSIDFIVTIYNRAATSERYIFQSNPQKLRNIMRFSTWKYVVEKKLAIGQTLYESKMSPNSS
jgi:hypothetical protein